MSAILNDFAQKQICEIKENMENETECSDFVSLYLQEVANSNGKLEDRYFSNQYWTVYVVPTRVNF